MDVRKVKARSAPLRYGKKASEEKKVTTLREINSWVQKGNNGGPQLKSSRNMGLLAENITEERMLFAKQVELGRERYKFLSQHAYEKNKFIDRQRRKHQSMRQTLTTSDNISQAFHHQPVARKLSFKLPHTRKGIESPSNIDKPEKSRENTVGSITLPAPRPKSGVSSVPVKASTGNQDKRLRLNLQKNVNVPPKKPLLLLRNCYLNTSSSSIETAKTPNTARSETLSFFPDVKSNSNVIVEIKSEKVERKPSLQKSVSFTAGLQRRRMTTETNIFIPGITDGTQEQQPTESVTELYDRECLASTKSIHKPWQRKAPTKVYGQKFEASVNDPRYMALKESLIPPICINKTMLTVKDIIQKNDILRRESKSYQEKNARLLHQKFLAFLMEKELAV